jgi:hypothetical protein
MRQKYNRNGHYFGDRFVLAITFYNMYIFKNVFTVDLHFAKEAAIKTIFMAIVRNAILSNIGKWP